MNQEFLPYLIAELFCILYALALFLRLKQSNHAGEEETELRRMILSYTVMVLTDAISVYAENSRFATIHVIDAASSAFSMTAVAMGCYYWYRFVSLRLKPDAVHTRLGQILQQVPIMVLCILDLCSGFTGWVFYINQDNHYEEGVLFWVQGIITTVYLLIPTVQSVFLAFRVTSAAKRREYLAYAGYICLGFAIVSVQDEPILKNVPIFEMGILLAVQILFLTLYLDREQMLARQEHMLAKQERELSESRMAVMLSQIQPHFLYNTLVVIQEMCSDKAPEAAETTVEFANFLRGNLDSLSRKEPITFAQELRHTQTYLSLERKRFGERLQVVYDIQATGFGIPALTLQPIVENAVQHGIMDLEDGGTVCISSVETADAYQVTVADNGAGFDPAAAPDGKRSHVGIANVRSRLEMLCDGTLEIQSAPGQGTRAIITIPKKREN